ncbi:MAG TPA: hypothetical protein VGB07_28785 [Blastocatellia bacterium]
MARGSSGRTSPASGKAVKNGPKSSVIAAIAETTIKALPLP